MPFLKTLIIIFGCIIGMQSTYAMQKKQFAKVFKTYVNKNTKKVLNCLKQKVPLNKIPKLSFGTTFLNNMRWKKIVAAGALATGYGLWQWNEMSVCAEDPIVQQDTSLIAEIAYELYKQGVLQKDEAIAFKIDPLTQIADNYRITYYLKDMCQKRPDLLHALGNIIALQLENDPVLNKERMHSLDSQAALQEFERVWSVIGKIYFCMELFYEHPQFREVVCKCLGKHNIGPKLFFERLPKSHKIQKEWITALFEHAYLWDKKTDVNFIVQAIMPYVVFEELSQEQQQLCNNIMSHSLELIPLDLLTQLKKEDKQLQAKLLSFYFAYGKHNETAKNVPQGVIACWESIFTNYTLEELYTMQEYARYGMQSTDQGLSALDTYQKSQFLFKEIEAQKSKLVSHDDELSTTCRNIALRHGLKIPTWIPFYAHSENGSWGPRIYVHIQEDTFMGERTRLQEDEVAFIMGHELGHIMLGHSYAEQIYGDDMLANYKTEFAADKFLCLRSKKACLGGIKWLSRFLRTERHEIIEENRDSSMVLLGEEYEHPRLNQFIEQELAELGQGKTHPAFQKRIKKAKKILNELKKEEAGLCKNPFYKQLGSQEWFVCKEGK